MAAELLDSFRSIETADVSGKRVLIRADLNVPMSGGQVTDATRIERLLPTFQDLLNRGAKVVILSHLGRPDGKAVAKYSLKPVADKLSSLLGVDVSSG
jgi:phosphoglycerate kinase